MAVIRRGRTADPPGPLGQALGRGVHTREGRTPALSHCCRCVAHVKGSGNTRGEECATSRQNRVALHLR